jgi:hypothetical protein
MEYHGLDVHRVSITYTCVSADSWVLRHVRVPLTPEVIRGIVAPSCGRAWDLLLEAYTSGGRVRMGRLTKEGPPLVRSYLVQAARVAVARKLAILAYLPWRFSVKVPSREYLLKGHGARRPTSD